MRIRREEKRAAQLRRWCAPYVGRIKGDWQGGSLLHSGCYLVYPRSSGRKRLLKQQTGRRVRRADLPPRGNAYRRVLDYHWLLD